MSTFYKGSTLTNEDLGTSTSASNTLGTWLLDSPATHPQDHTPVPVITRNCSTSEITLQTSQSLVTVSSPHPCPLPSPHLSSDPAGASSPSIPVVLFSVGNDTHLFLGRNLIFFLSYGYDSNEVDSTLTSGQPYFRRLATALGQG